MQTIELLTQAQKDQFENDGYFVTDSGVPTSVLDGVIADLAGKYPPSDTPLEQGPPYPQRYLDAWKISRNAHKLAVFPRILAVLRELYGRKPLPFQTLNFPVGTQQLTHSDTVHFNSAPHTFMCGVWVALEDVDMDNGPLMYYPGSNKLPEFTMADVGVPATPEYIPQYEQFIQKVIKDLNLKPAYGVVKKGQAFIWSSNLLHGGARMRNPHRTRHSQVTHYYFERCRYYTPLNSQGTNIFWRQPEWIPEL